MATCPECKTAHPDAKAAEPCLIAATNRHLILADPRLPQFYEYYAALLLQHSDKVPITQVTRDRMAREARQQQFIAANNLLEQNLLEQLALATAFSLQDITAVYQACRKSLDDVIRVIKFCQVTGCTDLLGIAEAFQLPAY